MNKMKTSALLAFLIGWEVISRAGVFSPFIFPSIVGSVIWAIENYVYVLESAWTTLRLLLISLVVSTTVSLIMGGVASISKSVKREWSNAVAMNKFIVIITDANDPKPAPIPSILSDCQEIKYDKNNKAKGLEQIYRSIIDNRQIIDIIISASNNAHCFINMSLQ